VLRLAVDEDEVVSRLTGRRTCTACGAVFHVDHQPPATEGVCDACGGELVQRDDDREDVVRNRLEVYRRSTEPLEEFYWNRGLLRDVEAVGTVDEVGRARRRGARRARARLSPRHPHRGRRTLRCPAAVVHPATDAKGSR
jgi:adenylate kinase